MAALTAYTRAFAHLPALLRRCVVLHQNQSGSVQVVVLPKSADVLGGMEDGGGCATLMLATDSVRRTATTAVRAGRRTILQCTASLPSSHAVLERELILLVYQTSAVHIQPVNGTR